MKMFRLTHAQNATIDEVRGVWRLQALLRLTTTLTPAYSYSCPLRPMFLSELHLQTMTAVNENNPERFSAAEIRSMLVALEADNKVMVRDDTITLIAS